MIDDGYFRSCLVSVYYLGLGDATVYLHALGFFFFFFFLWSFLHALGFHYMDLMTFVNDPLQLSFDSLNTEIQRC